MGQKSNAIKIVRLYSSEELSRPWDEVVSDVRTSCPVLGQVVSHLGQVVLHLGPLVPNVGQSGPNLGQIVLNWEQGVQNLKQAVPNWGYFVPSLRRMYKCMQGQKPAKKKT